MRNPLVVFHLLLATAATVPAARPLAEVIDDAERFSVAIDLPRFETTVDEVQATAAATLAWGEAALERIAGQDPGAVTFESTFGALDRLHRTFGEASQRLSLIRSTHPTEAVRDAAAEACPYFGTMWR